MFCQECQTFGTPKMVKPGSDGLASFMRVLFPFNVIHYIWRVLFQYKACRNCGSRDLIPEGEVDDMHLGRIIGGKDYVDEKLRNGEEVIRPRNIEVPENKIKSNQSSEEW